MHESEYGEWLLSQTNENISAFAMADENVKVAIEVLVNEPEKGIVNIGGIHSFEQSQSTKLENGYYIIYRIDKNNVVEFLAVCNHEHAMRIINQANALKDAMEEKPSLPN